MSLKMQAVAGTALLVAGMLSLAWAYNYGGGADPGPLDRAGWAVTWGLPAAKLLCNLASAGTIGALVLAACALPRGGAAYLKALRWAGWSAAVWAAGACIHTSASFLFMANRSPAAGFDEAFLTFLTGIDAGRSGTLTILIATAVAISCSRLRGPRMLALTTVTAFAGLLPLVMTSHAAGSTDHADSTTALFVHSATAAVWLGGLLALMVLRPVLPPGQLGATVRRYSTLALVCFIALAVSGYMGALATISTIEAVFSPYGAIVLAKAAVLIILGVFGAFHRRWSINRLEIAPERGGRLFAALAVAELAVMGIASGMAAALARTEPPPAATSGEPGPVLPEPGLWEYLSGWAPDPLWSLVCGFAVVIYLAGIRRLHTTGRSWPVHRTLLWLAGVAVLFIVTNGGVHAYQGYLFNAHVLTQMLLTAIVPLLVVPAAPLTLATLTVLARTDGSAGAKEFLERTVQPVLAALTRDPFLAVPLLAASLFAIYYTPLLDWAATGQIGYSAMSLLALVTGCLATAALTGNQDPGTGGAPGRRLPVLAGIVGLYAFCGWRLMEQAPSMELPWSTSAGRPWGQSPAAAAELAGPAMWSIAALMLGILTVMIIFRREPGPGDPRAGTANSHARSLREDVAA